MAQKKSSNGRNDNRPNGKAFKKKPGPAQPPKTNFTHINGRSPENNAKREAWKAMGGRSNHTSIPHWKTGKVYAGPFPYKVGAVEASV